MYNLVELTGRHILITGASSGMGKETAILCSKLGATVTLVARNEENLQKVLSELGGENHKYYTFDLSRVEEIEGFIKNVVAETGAFDGFVHSAGITSNRPFKQLKPSILYDVMNINYFSFIEIVRGLTKKNCFNEGMSIVGISSISSKRGNKAKTAYCASKAAMDASVRCLAKELSPKKIRVNTVNPSFIKTEIYQQFIDNCGDGNDAKNVMFRQYLGLGEPIDVANMIAFLLSSASKFITGTHINVDGGSLSV